MSALCKDIKTELLICGYIRKIKYLPDSLTELCISFYGFIFSKEYKVMIKGSDGSNQYDIIAMDGVITNDFWQDKQITQYVTIDNELCLLDILISQGHEEFSSLQDEWMFRGHAYLFVYSVTSRIYNEGEITT